MATGGVSSRVALSAVTPSVAIVVTPDSRLQVFDRVLEVGAVTPPPRTCVEKAHLAARYGVVSNHPTSSSVVAVGCADGTITVWDVRTGTVLQRLGMGTASTAATKLSDSLSGRKRGHGEMESASPSVRHTSPVTALAWSPDGTTLYSAAEGSIHIIAWRLAWTRHGDGGTVSRVAVDAVSSLAVGDRSGCTALAVAPSGTTLLAARVDIVAIDLGTGRKVARFTGGHALPVAYVAMCGAGKGLPSTHLLFASAAPGERNVAVWDADVTRPSRPDGTHAPAAVCLHHTAAPPTTRATLAGTLAIQLSPHRSTTAHLVCLGEDGTAALWRVKRRKPGSSDGGDEEGTEAGLASGKPVPPACLITGAKSGEKAGSAPVRAVQLVATAGGGRALVAAAGSTGSPVFFVRPYLTDDGKVVSDTITLTVDPAASSKARAAAVMAGVPNGHAMEDEEEEGDEEEGEGEDAEGHDDQGEASAPARPQAATAGMAIGREHVAMTKVAVVAPTTIKRGQPAIHGGVDSMTAPDAKEADEAEVAGGGDGGKSLGERMAAVMAALRSPGLTASLLTAPATVGDGAATPVPATTTVAPPAASALAPAARTMTAASALATTGSLATVLSQALHSGDDATLEVVLNYGDGTVQTNTVARLPTKYITSFLTRLVAKLQSSPSRGAQLLPWLREVLTQHSTFLLSLPDLVDRVALLYTTLDSRVSVFKKLLKLSGRLELLMQHIDAKEGRGSRPVVGGAGASGTSTKYRRTLARARRVVTAAELQARSHMAGAKKGEEEGDDEGDDDEEEEEEGDDDGGDDGGEDEGEEEGEDEEGDDDDDDDEDYNEEEEEDDDEGDDDDMPLKPSAKRARPAATGDEDEKEEAAAAAAVKRGATPKGAAAATPRGGGMKPAPGVGSGGGAVNGGAVAPPASSKKR